MPALLKSSFFLIPDHELGKGRYEEKPGIKDRFRSEEGASGE
jgi:hypothetical protein